MRFNVRLFQYAFFSSGGQRHRGTFEDDSFSTRSAHAHGVHTSDIALFHSTSRLRKKAMSSSTDHQEQFHLSRDSTSSIFLRPCLSGVKAKTAFGCAGKEVLIGNGNNVKDDPVVAPPSTGVASSIDGNSLSAIKLSPTS